MSLNRFALLAALLAVPSAGLAQDPKVQSLEKRLAEVSTRFSEATKNSLEMTDEQLKVLQAILDELKTIRAELQALRGGAKPPSVVSPASKTKIYGFVQTQLTDIDQPNANDGFRMRRVRLRLDHVIDPRLELRTAYEFAAGANNTTAELRDAMTVSKLGPKGDMDRTHLYMGQMLIPIGNDINWPQFDYEFGERTVYNNIQFPGYRMRGAYMDHVLTKGLVLTAGTLDTLPFKDPEMRNTTSTSFGRLSGFATLKWKHDESEVQVAALSGDRPSVEVSGKKLEATPRVYSYLSGRTRLADNLYLRGEVMMGRDRIQAGGATTATNQLGYYGTLTLKLPPRHDLNFRYQFFDRDTDFSGDSVSAYALSLRYGFTTEHNLLLAYERFEEHVRSGLLPKEPFGHFTARIQVKF